METSKKISLTAAMVAGYVLGRTRKGKLAIGFASLVAGQQLPLNPRELVSMGARKLAANEQFAPLVKQVRGEVLDAGRKALSATANRRLEGVADALQQRTEALREPPAEEAEPEEEEAPTEEAETEEEEAPTEEAETAEKEAPTEEAEPAEKEEDTKRTSSKRPPAKKTGEKKLADKKPADKKPAPRTSRRR
jgi:hypothetical protein